MANSPSYVEELMEHIGEEPVNYVLRQVREGNFSQHEAGRFAKQLHKEANGAFINSRKEYGEEAMELILSKWYERGIQVSKLTKEEAVCKLISALQKARKEMMADKIQEMCSMGSQDTTDARAGMQVVPNNAPQVHQPSAPTKVVTDLPSHPHPIPGLTKASTGTTPVPSDQGTDPVCASHAIGKATVAIFDDCGFDMVDGNLGQHKVIEDLIQEVQPDKKPRNPDEFHKRKIKVEIVRRSEPEEKRRIEIQFDVKTEWSNIPKMTNKDLKEKKIRMVLRFLSAGIPHAIYSKEYDPMEGHSTINSWGLMRDPYPQLDKTVYAIDYIQITEI